MSSLHAVEQRFMSSIIGQSASQRDKAIRSALIDSAAVMLVLALALFFTIAVGRSMTRPLRRLRTGALEVAGTRLPETVRKMSEGVGTDAPLEIEPIDVDSSDEIGEVARAFDQVHREAVRLAANEAALRGNVNAMFVNLSRRSQSLVERQIRLIDDLEQGEQDSERLANLFQMDHLATRMRRNSENLLVLAGHELSRQRAEPVALVDVLRAAVSEIEQYERVVPNIQPGISVRGQAVNDVVHLLSELAENATTFSPADTPVNVSGHLLNSGGALLDISDQGVGMDADEMAHANWRLDNPPVVDVAVSRRMGLFVVARLAARHGIRVRLRPASQGGLTALVWLPDEVIMREPSPRPWASAGSSRPRRTPRSRSPGRAARPRGGRPFGAAAQAVAAARVARFEPFRRPGEAPTDPGLVPDGSDLAAAPTAEADRARVGGGHHPGLRDRWRRGPRPTAGARTTAARHERQPRNGAQRRYGDAPAPTACRTATERRRAHGDAARRDSAARDERRRGEPAADFRVGRIRLVPARPAWRRLVRPVSARPCAQSRPRLAASPADAGWQAAEVAQAPVTSGTTRAGLPKRVPKANLVPGGVTMPAAAAPSPRSAAQTRERLASFQQGVRNARAVAPSDDDHHRVRAGREETE